MNIVFAILVSTSFAKVFVNIWMPCSVTRFTIQGFNKGFKLPQLAWINLHIFVIISMDFTAIFYFR